MEFPLLVILPLATFALLIAFAVWSKRETKEAISDPHDRKSSLAKDGPGPNPFHPDR